MHPDNIENENTTLYAVEPDGTTHEIKRGEIPDITEALAKAADSIAGIAEYMNLYVKPMIENACIIFTRMYNNAFALASCKNGRLRHLAQYHPKKRVRKKNLHRIQRELRRGGH